VAKPAVEDASIPSNTLQCEIERRLELVENNQAKEIQVVPQFKLIVADTIFAQGLQPYNSEVVLGAEREVPYSLRKRVNFEGARRDICQL
jgi:hypothetical protein